MKKPHQFGGDWTAEKLERVRKYLAAYTNIFATNPRAKKLTPIYVDAFAGTGYRAQPSHLDAQTALFAELTEPDAQGFLQGSARIALEVEPPFHRYIFVEVAENPLPLRNSRNVPLYLLCFAAGNPKGAKTALKIAEDILKK